MRLDQPAQANERARMVENQRRGVHQVVRSSKAIFRLGIVVALESREALCGKLSGLVTPVLRLRLQGPRVEREEHEQRAGSQ